MKHLKEGININIGILYGGNSNESQYSVLAANNIKSILETQYENISMLQIDNENAWILTLADKKIDIVLNLVYGYPGQEGIIQGMLELLKIPYLGSNFFSAIYIKDKYIAKILAKENGIDTPKDIRIEKKDYINRPDYWYRLAQIKKIFPCVIKPCRKGGLSLGINYCEDDFSIFNEYMNEAYRYDEIVLLEKYIEGRELTVCVYSYKKDIVILPIIEVIKKGKISNFDEKQRGTRQICIPAQIDEKLLVDIQKKICKLFSAFEMCHYGYFDLIVSQNQKIYFIEAGTVPGFTKNSNFPQALASAGIEVKEFFGLLLTDLYESNRSSEF